MLHSLQGAPAHLGFFGFQNPMAFSKQLSESVSFYWGASGLGGPTGSHSFFLTLGLPPGLNPWVYPNGRVEAMASREKRLETVFFGGP